MSPVHGPSFRFREGASVRQGCSRCAADPLASGTGPGIVNKMRRARLDLVAVTAAVLSVVMLVVYLWVLRQQDGQPAMWAITLLILGAAAASYGSVTNAPYRRAALLVSACALAALGLLAILTLGMPILLASALCLVAAVRHRPAPT
jgi:hypothetical protein